MLSDLFDIRYRHPERTPIQLKIDGNTLVIDCCFRYNRKALRLLPGSALTAADIVEAGIRRAWSGSYRLDLPGLQETVETDEGEPASNLVRVRVVIHRDGRRRPARITLQTLLVMPAHVISPLHRRIWGVFKTGQLESLGTNWSLENPGRMVLPQDLTIQQMRNIAAHEAGHLFGLGDAYGAIYRFYDAVPGKEAYMMYSNQRVHPEEITMLLNAHQSGRMQFFPKKWNGRRFVRGLRADMLGRAAQIERRLAAWKTRRHQPPAQDDGETTGKIS